MQRIFPILIHSEFYKVLREADSRVRARIQKTLQRLHVGDWGNGTRVKRLAGVPHAIYEARVDKGDRLLFTAVRAADGNAPEKLTTHLQIWDVVHHDAVSRSARRNPAPEAGFLKFATVEEFDIIEAPPIPDATFSEVSSDGSEPLLHLLIPPDDFAPRESEGITGAVRWYLAPPVMLAGETDLQNLLDAGGEELELKLLKDQYDVLRSPGPLLLAGSAGSGKTTIAIHRLVEARFQSGQAKLLYLSYSPWLVEYARRLYSGVTLARGGDPKIQPPDFYTFPELYRKLILQAESERQADLVTRESFALWLRKSGSRLDPALVWEELRSILKGACLNLGQPMLEEQEYQDLGRKRAPLFVNERAEIFPIAQRYQQWLSEQRRLDQIDLCRRAFRETRHGRVKKYDVIVCDEIQDLTELEVRFVLSLSSDPNLRGVMLAGDTQQIVNPSGFRWAEARQAVMKAGSSRVAPALARLRRNCRSVRPLVEIANAVLNLRQEIFGRYDEDSAEDAVAEGPAPIQVVEDEKRVLDAIRGFGPCCAILVLNESDAATLGKLLDTTRIFNVRDAKGLEFETVILWKLVQSEPGLVDRFMRNDSRIETDARFKQFLQHLYVAVTRARRRLAVFEGPTAHPFWNHRQFRGRLDVEKAEVLHRLFQDSASPAEWKKEAEYFFERARFRQAAECYRRAGLDNKETEAHASHAETMEDWAGALHLWERVGRLDRQAALFERLGRLTEAIEAYRKLGQTGTTNRLETLLLEKQGRWAEAAKRWEDEGNSADAVRCYQRAGQSSRALSLEAAAAELQKDWKRAAECWFAVKSWAPAVRCFRKARDLKNAALAEAFLHESAKDWEKAANAFRRAGDRAKSDDCRALALESDGDLLNAAKLRERLGQNDRALHLYRKAGNEEAIERFAVERADLRQSQRLKVEDLINRGHLQLAIKLAKARCDVLKKRLRTGTNSFSDKLDDRVVDERYALEDAITTCHALLAEKAGQWKKAASHWRRIENYQRADLAQDNAVKAIEYPIARGREWLLMGQYEKALESFESAANANGAGEARALLFEKANEWKSAAEIWHSLGQSRRHAACMARWARSLDRWEEAARWHHLAGERTKAADAERAARGRQAAEAARVKKEHATLF
jgi:DNA helicase II / ATP-dependent DNA helicase PcrA